MDCLQVIDGEGFAGYSGQILRQRYRCRDPMTARSQTDGPAQMRVIRRRGGVWQRVLAGERAGGRGSGGKNELVSCRVWSV